LQHIARQKKVKTDGKKKAPSKASDQPPAENVRGLARWLDGAERRDKDLSEGIMVTVLSGARPGSRLRKVVVSASSVAKYNCFILSKLREI